MRGLVICLVVVGLVVLPAKASPDGAGKSESAQATKTNEKFALDAKVATATKDAASTNSKDAPVEVEVQQLRDLVQRQAQDLESQRAALREAILEWRQENEALREELRVSRSRFTACGNGLRRSSACERIHNQQQQCAAHASLLGRCAARPMGVPGRPILEFPDSEPQWPLASAR